MAKKMNWSSAQKSKPTEMKYETGTELRSGKVVVNDKPDELARRAKEAEALWRKRRGLTKDLKVHPNIQKARMRRPG